MLDLNSFVPSSAKIIMEKERSLTLSTSGALLYSLDKSGRSMEAAPVVGWIVIGKETRSACSGPPPTPDFDVRATPSQRNWIGVL